MDSATAKALCIQMSAVYDANKEPKWNQKLANPFVKADDGTYTHKSVLKGAYKGEVTNKPLQVDSQGTPLKEEFQLTTGSTISVAVSFYAYHMSKENWGVALRLYAVQVIKYVPKAKSNPFAAVEGGFVSENPNPFKKSNNVLAEEPVADVDDFDEEPVKKTAKKAVAAPSDDGDLGSIIDNWDD